MDERPPRTPISVYYYKVALLKENVFISEKCCFKPGSVIVLSTDFILGKGNFDDACVICFDFIIFEARKFAREIQIEFRYR